MNKKTVIIVVVAILATAIVVGGGVYFLTNKNKTSTSTTSSNTTTSNNSNKAKSGNELVQSVLDTVKAKVPTVQQTRVYTESTDGNNMLNKQGSYQYAGSFYDTRTNYQPSVEFDGSTDITKANYGVSAGGVIEVFANNVDAKKRYDYIQAIGSSIGAPEGDRLVNNVVLRVSENYTASQQKEMLDLMQGAL